MPSIITVAGKQLGKNLACDNLFTLDKMRFAFPLVVVEGEMAQHFGLRDLIEPVPVDYVRVDGLGYVECLRSNYGLWFFSREHMAGGERMVNIVRAKLLLPSDRSLSDQLQWEWTGLAH